MEFDDISSFDSAETVDFDNSSSDMFDDSEIETPTEIAEDTDDVEMLDFDEDSSSDLLDDSEIETPTEIAEDTDDVEMLDFDEDSSSDLLDDSEIETPTEIAEDTDDVEMLDFDEDSSSDLLDDSEIETPTEIAEDTDDVEMLDFDEDSSSDLLDDGGNEMPTEIAEDTENITSEYDESLNFDNDDIQNETEENIDAPTSEGSYNEDDYEDLENDSNHYVDQDSSEYEEYDDGPQKVLKRDPDELLEVGNSIINDRLDMLADQYRDEGLSEQEIADKLAEDKINIQQEFLDDAFPGQDITPEVFNRFENPTNPETSQDIKPLSDIDNWLGDINPNYDPFDIESPYCNNCGSCAYAVHQRLEGNPDICATAENIGYNSEMESLTGMEQVSMTPEEIEQRLLEQGEGAHVIIGIDRAEGAGHWFNAANIDGKVVAIDGQTGEITDWPPDYGDVVNWEMSVKKGE